MTARRAQDARTVEEMPLYGLFYSLALEVEKATRTMGPDFVWLRSEMLRSSESVCVAMNGAFYAIDRNGYLQGLRRCREASRRTLTHVGYAVDTAQIDKQAAAGITIGYEEAMHQLDILVASVERDRPIRVPLDETPRSSAGKTHGEG